MEKDQELELTVDRATLEGKGVARVDGFVIFTDRGLPGERVRVRLSRVRKRFAEADVLETLAPSPHAVTPPCPHFGQCGGCAWQDLDYAEQLVVKRSFVADALARIAGAETCEVAQTLPSPRTLHFRNKMEFAFAGAGDTLRLGLRRRASHEVLDVDGCLLMEEPCAQVVSALRVELAASQMPAWSAHRGHLRFAVVRKSATGDRSGRGLVVQLIVANATPRVQDVAHAVGTRLMERFSEITGFVLGERNDSLQVAYSERNIFILGSDRLRETLFGEGDETGLRYEFGVGTFFQTNTAAAELLYRAALAAAAMGPDFAPEHVWDLYAGCGGITLFLARELARLKQDDTLQHGTFPNGMVTGMESGREAVEDGWDNAATNGLENCKFLTGDLRRLLQEKRSAELCAPDLIVLDPPRGGMHADIRNALLRVAPQRIIYVSCDPATLARDVKALAEEYAPVRALPVDLFPHAPHVECVLTLERRK